MPSSNKLYSFLFLQMIITLATPAVALVVAAAATGDQADITKH
jgi:uncharacterized RDD family membrane protein YckC